MERSNGTFQMLNFFVPVIFYCAVVPGEINTCSSTTKFYSETLDPVPTPSKCLLEGYIRAMQYIDDWNKEHPNKEITHRIVCERSSVKT